MTTTGIFTAAVIIFSQIYCFQEACCKNEKLSKNEQQKEDEKTNGHKVFFTMPSSVIPSPAAIELDQETAFICNIPLNEKGETFSVIEIPAALGKLFQTLFRVIISPNAP